MPTSDDVEPFRRNAERFFSVVVSLDNFDKIEIRPAIDALANPSVRELCFIAMYRRSAANIASLQELKSAKHFQAIVMLARSLFELAVDIRLLNCVTDGCLRMIEFVDVEKLRCAKKVLKYTTDYPDAKIDISPYTSFISANETRVTDVRKSLWPNAKSVEHWSGLKMAARVKLLGREFEELYEVHYPYQSWHVHSGVTGIINLDAVTFTILCGYSFKLAGEAFRETLLTIIDEFKLIIKDPKIKRKLEAAKLLPFADTPQDLEYIRQHIL